MRRKMFTQYSDKDISIYISIHEHGFFTSKSGIIFKKISHKNLQKWKKNNKNKVINTEIKIYKNNKEKIIEYLGGECQHCGLKSPYTEIYDIHHLYPELKNTDNNRFAHTSFNKIKNELDNCILLCANCHRIIHKKLRDDKYGI